MVPEDLRSRELQEHHIIFRAAENQNIFALVTMPSHMTDKAPTAAQDLEMFKFKSEVLARDIQNIEQEFMICKRELEKECIKEKMQERQEELVEKEREGNHVAVADLLKEVNNLHKILKLLSAT